MADVNRVVLIGRLTRDADLKYTAAGFAIANFSVALNRRRKNGEQWEDEAHFFDITVYGKTAETLKPYLIKGKQVAIDGELRQDRWEQDGQHRSKVMIAANNIQLLGGNPGAGGGAAPYSGGSAGAYASNRAPSTQSRGYEPSPGGRAGQSDSSESPAGNAGAEFMEDVPF
jgi:single-strand DNA-binding protein